MKKQPVLEDQLSPNSNEKRADMDDVLTAKQASELLQLHHETVLRLLAAGKILGRKVGGVWRMNRSLILEWLAGAKGSKRNKQ
jgi:excisionase family DNA binding protein